MRGAAIQRRYLRVRRGPQLAKFNARSVIAVSKHAEHHDNSVARMRALFLALASPSIIGRIAPNAVIKGTRATHLS